MRRISLTPEQREAALNDFMTQLQAAKTTSSKIGFSVTMPAITDVEKAIIRFKPSAYNKMRNLININDKEVGWHGTISRTANVFTIEDILLFPQEVTGAAVIPDATEYTTWLNEIPDDTFNKMRFHGHSHVNMGVTPSGTDTTFQENITQNLEDFYVFIITNKAGAIWASIVDVVNNLIYETADITVKIPVSAEAQWATEQTALYVKEHVIATSAGIFAQTSIDTLEEAVAKLTETSDYSKITRFDSKLPTNMHYRNTWAQGYKFDSITNTYLLGDKFEKAQELVIKARKNYVLKIKRDALKRTGTTKAVPKVKEKAHEQRHASDYYDRWDRYYRDGLDTD